MNMEAGTSERLGTVDIYVQDASGCGASLGETRIHIFAVEKGARSSQSRAERAMCPEGETWLTDADGHFRTKLREGQYRVDAKCFGRKGSENFHVRAGYAEEVTCAVDVGFEVRVADTSGAASGQSPGTVKEGGGLLVELSWPLERGADLPTSLSASPGVILPGYSDSKTATRVIRQYVYHATVPGRFVWTARLSGGSFAEASGDGMIQPSVQSIAGNVGVTMHRTATAPTDDLAFWQGILNSTDRLSFNTYLRFMNMLFCGEDVSDLPDFEQQRFTRKRNLFTDELRPKRLLPFTDSDAYRVVKAATEAFVMLNCGILAPPRPFDPVGDSGYFARRDLPFPPAGLESVFDNDYLVALLGGTAGAKTLPYLALIRAKLPDIAIKFTPFEVAPEQVSACHGILQEKLANPCLLELIWSYWHEEGMLAQTVNAITRRFQNVRGPGAQDPLANLEIDPLRPLNNLL